MKVNEVLKSQLLHRKPMKARFKLPMNSELAAQYLTAAISAEVEYRNHPFRNGNELHKQVAIVAHWLCGMSGKNSLLLVGGCGNGKTTFVYAMQNLVNHLGIKNPATGQDFGISLYNAKDIVNICKTHPKNWRSLMDKEILAILVPSLAKSSNTAMCSVPSSTSSPTAMNTNCRLSSPPTSPLNKSQKCTASVSVTD